MSKSAEDKDFVDARSMSLQDWLNLLFDQNARGRYSFIDYEFPTSEHLLEYLDSIASRNDDEIKKLIRFFCIRSGSLGNDSWLLESLRVSDQLLPFVKKFEFGRRMLSGKPWEGMTWVLDLIPAWPKDAVNAVDSYILAHAQLLPDGRLRGLGQISQILNASAALQKT
jgi:restriction system protein